MAVDVGDDRQFVYMVKEQEGEEVTVRLPGCPWDAVESDQSPPPQTVRLWSSRQCTYEVCVNPSAGLSVWARVCTK